MDVHDPSIAVFIRPVLCFLIRFLLGMGYVFLWIGYIYVVAIGAPQAAVKRAMLLACYVWARVRASPIWVQAVLAALAAWVGVAILIHCWAAGLESRTFIGDIVQLSFSSWPNRRPRSDTWGFAFGVSARLTLVVGAIGGLIKVFQDIINLRRAVSMKYEELIKFHDISVKARFLSNVTKLVKAKTLPTDVDGMRDVLTQTLAEADNATLQGLQRLFGEHAAKTVL
jgi:hypothetical protein